MIAEAFLDTNVLLYAYDSRTPEKQAVAQRLLVSALRARDAVISVQVLGEFYVNATRKIAQPITPEVARTAIDALRQLPCVAIDGPMVADAVASAIRFQLSYWDALIIASARRAGCSRIYSEDLSANQDYDGVTVINPFAADHE